MKARPSRRFVWHLLGAIAAGALWGLCFRRHPDPVLPWIALVPLLVWTLDRDLAAGRRFVLGWLHGTVAWLVAIPWIARTLVIYGELPQAVGLFLLLLLALYLGLYHGLFALGGGWLARGSSESATGLAVVSLPALWVLLEWLRSWLFTGFPWNLAGYALVEVPAALPAAALVGSRGLSWLLVAVNAGLALALVRRRRGPALLALLVSSLILVVAVLVPSGVAPIGEPLPVRVVQPNVTLEEQRDTPAEGYRRVLDLATAACDEPGALIVLPESATFPYSWQFHAAVRRELEALTARGCSLLLNTAWWQDDERVYNAVLLVEPDGLAARYDKVHLVPWGEYVPLRDLLPFVGTLARNAGNFSAGNGFRPMAWRDDALGIAICFEIIFPEEVAARVRSGAGLLVTVTNDAWYGRTSAPWQHLRAARFRAAETGRPLLRAALTGISAIVGEDGSVRASLDLGETGTLRAAVRSRRGATPYLRAPWLVTALATFALLVAIGSRFRPRSSERTITFRRREIPPSS